jgi:hypothetical protein
MRIQKFSRPGVILLATVVAIITSMVVANATQTITTPNAVNIPYTLAPSTSSAPITPVANRPVLVMGCCATGAGEEDVGQVTLISSNGFITWVGLQSGGAVSASRSATAGTNIVSIDGDQVVDIQVNSGTTIRINNGEGFTVGR